MSLEIGKLDRQITIQRATTAQNGSGQHIPTWVTLQTEYAEINPTTGSEAYRNHQDVDKLTKVFRIRYFSGLLVTDRISFEGEIYDIISPKPGGHRQNEYIDIVAERVVQGAGR